MYITNYGANNLMGFVPGPNASFMRFLENHDQTRISAVYGSYEMTMPAATIIMTAPGLPMIYSGQEVGYGLGISNLLLGSRGVIDWNWSFIFEIINHQKSDCKDKIPYFLIIFPISSVELRKVCEF